MRFVQGLQRIDVSMLSDEATRGDEMPGLASHAADVLERHGFIVFRIGALRLGREESRSLACQITDAMRREFIDRGAPEDLALECGRVEKTVFNGDHETRTMLPHQDGGHTSYLTPSILDEPGWPVQRPSFAEQGYTTTPAHKMYQAIFIVDPGEGLSVTTYYDWLTIIEDAKRAQNPGDDRTLSAWFGENITRMVAERHWFGFGYPTLAAMLGGTGDAVTAIPLLRSEEDLPAEAKQRYPELSESAARCPCGACAGETRRTFCHVTHRTLGLSWPQFRERYEVLVPSERYDLPFAHNLTMLHGGLCGGRERLMEPMCLVVNEPAGPAYERWLRTSWRRPAAQQTGTLADSVRP